MKPHHTKQKGDLGVLKAQTDLCQNGYLICIPLTEHAPFDLIAYKDGIFLRIQVKYISENNWKLSLPFKNNWSDKNKLHYLYYVKDEIDLFCIYCPQTDKCYYINPKLFNKSVSIRIKKTRNNQSKNINFAEDFTIQNALLV